MDGCLVTDNAVDVMGDFIANAPLYKRLDLESFAQEGDFEGVQPGGPDTILRYCPHHRCKAERPYRLIRAQAGVGSSNTVPREPRNIITMLYECTHCESRFWCSFQTSEGAEGGEWIQKIGQVPPYDISIPSDLADALGDDAVLYKRAQICMSQSFGVGACTYLRRLLENQIAPLLQLVYQARKEEGEDVSDFSAIMEERTAEKKIRLANEVLPASVAVEGDNPLELIYDRLSAGLHRQSEQECMGIAVEASEVLGHVIISLNDEYQRRQSKNRYVEMIRGLRKRGG